MDGDSSESEVELEEVSIGGGLFLFLRASSVRCFQRKKEVLSLRAAIASATTCGRQRGGSDGGGGDSPPCSIRSSCFFISRMRARIASIFGTFSVS